MITAILQFFGRILLWIYNFTSSYALSLAIFTLLTKVVLFPLSYMSKQSMMRMNAMSEEMQRLQKQYGKDQQRYNMEVQKLYEEEKVNPLSGCLWSLLPLPVLMALYYVIRRPMLYMLCLTEDQITTVVETLEGLGHTFESTQAAYQEIYIMDLISKDSSLYNAVAEALGDAASQLQTMSFNFLGINLGEVPDWQFWNWDAVNWNNIGLALIPILIVILNFFYSRYSMKSNQVKKQDDDKKDDASNAAAGSSKMMMYLMPLMYLWFGYIMPAGMCVYMACSTIFSILQDMIFAKFINKKFEKERLERQARMEERRSQEKNKKAEIAARRAAVEEEMKKKGGKKAVRQAQKKVEKASRDSNAGQIGIRRYARGRAYDPDRYPTTPYRDPQDVLDEEALERMLAKRGRLKDAPEELTKDEAGANAAEESADQVTERSEDTKNI
ncbi:MAG: membrane protein insertase YidC [Clostridiales bacterium]|nr:membrane protein insertase YidC [Clostridiales bacterium]